jgi:hypothetical protein
MRRIALLVCIIFIAASLLSAAFILTHANHAHDHAGPDGSCATCAHVMAAGNLLRTVGIAVAMAALSFGTHYAVSSALKHIASESVLPTLVSLKVQLNN